MNKHIQAVNFDADSKLIDNIEKKINKLNHFHDKITNIDIYLKLDNVVHNIKDKIVEIKVNIPKHEFFVKHTCKTFEESFEAAMAAVISQLKRNKERLIA